MCRIIYTEHSVQRAEQRQSEIVFLKQIKKVLVKRMVREQVYHGEHVLVVARIYIKNEIKQCGIVLQAFLGNTGIPATLVVLTVLGFQGIFRPRSDERLLVMDIKDLKEFPKIA